MLNKKHKKYLRVAALVSISCVLLYKYAFEKGYSVGLSKSITTIPAKVEQALKPSLSATPNYESLYPVVHVVDGDTIDIKKGGTKVRVRLLGINSPESVDPRRPIECYGKESKDHMTDLVLGKKIRLELDSQKPEKDEYGRVLAYVFTEEGVFVNKQMIGKGYAYEYTYQSEDYKFQDDFKDAQKKARAAAAGLWQKDTCNGKK